MTVLACVACRGWVDLTVSDHGAHRCPCGRSIAWVEADGVVTFHGPAVAVAGAPRRRALQPLL